MKTPTSLISYRLQAELNWTKLDYEKLAQQENGMKASNMFHFSPAHNIWQPDGSIPVFNLGPTTLDTLEATIPAKLELNSFKLGQKPIIMSNAIRWLFLAWEANVFSWMFVIERMKLN